MGLMHQAKKAVGRALKSDRAGAPTIAIRKLGVEHIATLNVSSPAFAPGHELPRSATADGEETPPPLRWDDVPEGTRSFVIVCEDPDAPFPDPFVHWIVFDIPPTERAIDLVSGPLGHEGTNSKLGTGFTGAAPPPGHGMHHYHFQVFALDCELGLAKGAGRTELFEAMDGHVLACGDVVGAYERG